MCTLGSYDPNDYQEIYDEDLRTQIEELYTKAEKQPENSTARTEAFNAYNAAVRDARLKQWRNRCVSDGYEPGSTFKILTLAAALDSGAVTTADTFYCGGSEKIEGRRADPQLLEPCRPWQRDHSAGPAEILQHRLRPHRPADGRRHAV